MDLEKLISKIKEEMPFRIVYMLNLDDFLDPLFGEFKDFFRNVNKQKKLI